MDFVSGADAKNEAPWRVRVYLFSKEVEKDFKRINGTTLVQTSAELYIKPIFLC